MDLKDFFNWKNSNSSKSYSSFRLLHLAFKTLESYGLIILIDQAF
jgi:hypothetical protein